MNDIFDWFSNYHMSLATPADKKVLQGTWSEDSRWEFCLSSSLPDKELCTAVFGVPKVKDSILLTKTIRGWELPGGHIEKKEKIVDTLKREILEEVGFVVQRAVLYGYRKIITSKIAYNKQGQPYPYPISYIPHFIIASDLPLKNTTGEEVLDSGVFSIESTEVQNSSVKEIIDISCKEMNRVL